MIVVTGAAGFISSCLITELNKRGNSDLVLVDDFSIASKKKNWDKKAYWDKIERSIFIKWFKENHQQIDFVFHLGARTDTTEFDVAIFNELNIEYSKAIWKTCVEYKIPLIYASSAATYGLGEHGYKDSHGIVPKLKPLNPYGDSKNDFDKWVLTQTETPPYWYGLKFFNVYGPNEYHKGRMASVVFHAYKQIKDTNGMKLFRSHDPKYKDGEQLRDFIYVKDVVDICLFLKENSFNSGIVNVGTGKARTFLDLVNTTFDAMDKTPDISYIDTPEDIRDKYQYFTEADMSKLKSFGYNKPFSTLEEGVRDYVVNYLMRDKVL